MKIAVTGYNGNVGKELIRRGCIPLECDITKEETIKEAINKAKPDVIVHAAAMTNVDECETNSKEAFNINVKGTSNLVDCMTKNQTLINLSTNHVFSGKMFWTYSETHKPSPVNVYGFTKLASEHLVTYSVIDVFTVRSNRLFNLEMLGTDMRQMRDMLLPSMPVFIKRSFTYLPDFVDGLMYIIENKDRMPRLLHLSTNEMWSYCQFWQMIAIELGYKPTEYVKERRNELEGTSPRPHRAGFNCDLAKKSGVPIPTVIEGIRKMLRS